MKWILIVVGGLVAVIALLALVGLMLPRNHRATSQIHLSQSPDSAWAAIRDFAGMAAWWPELKRVERLPDQNGRERWQESMGNDFSMILVVDQAEAPRRLQTTIEASANAPFGGDWIYEIEPDGAGSLVRITENGWVANPFFRVISRGMGYHRTLDSYLTALGRRFGEEVKPVHVAQ